MTQTGETDETWTTIVCTDCGYSRHYTEWTGGFQCPECLGWNPLATTAAQAAEITRRLTPLLAPAAPCPEED